MKLSNTAAVLPPWSLPKNVQLPRLPDQLTAMEIQRLLDGSSKW